MTKVPSQDRVWRKSSRSNSGPNCLEITMDVVDGTQDIRDSKDPTGSTLRFRRRTILAFFNAVKRDSMG